MQFKYPFQIVSNDKIPIMDIRITNKDNGKSTNYRAELDSGAFANVFHSDVAKLLEIDLSKIKEIQLFGGVKESKGLMKGKACIVELMIIQKGRSYKFGSYVIFSDEVSDTGFALLGRQGFFDQFDEICFNYRNNKFYLQVPD
ncbi:hypothetical protein A2865_03630 [Candidatus Woesebacteria bacterium RIFCSPHIGHO2_01_FULL_39_17]|uniref:Peptidase A2 domain-containing protein n=2 Tax=Candidatus Woeseibacteriota TaxID=1752722 RepID=A0A0G0LPF3_9BACT|nr:MAG: hypothetical protein US72_C0007G0041 [Microgenomates group bacterium GW2011_GWC1_38_12]KKQ93758.1 MAG: hypothetical protein UT19_C0007G0002 [Candidatus Woesebacteria bacterium GW2011_GWB1_39_10b]OGM23622.1 MAG: hypothetical protein A2865_03630 [Candidatus Woesebacteria bacterium RIFCSPHIGHO2_01_FULL_39_17]OGM64357.1 MAG: hypothetical protein A3A52_05485 [Candidatus Woesebacteria bacterium RIFCSPLOWO2_01_FULL_39_14]